MSKVCKPHQSIHDLKKKIFVFSCFENFNIVVEELNFLHSFFNHHVFMMDHSSGSIISIFYVDDILITRVIPKN